MNVVLHGQRQQLQAAAAARCNNLPLPVARPQQQPLQHTRDNQSLLLSRARIYQATVCSQWNNEWVTFRPWERAASDIMSGDCGDASEGAQVRGHGQPHVCGRRMSSAGGSGAVRQHVPRRACSIDVIKSVFTVDVKRRPRACLGRQMWAKHLAAMMAAILMRRLRRARRVQGQKTANNMRSQLSLELKL